MTHLPPTTPPPAGTPTPDHQYTSPLATTDREKALFKSVACGLASQGMLHDEALKEAVYGMVRVNLIMWERELAAMVASKDAWWRAWDSVVKETYKSHEDLRAQLAAALKERDEARSDLKREVDLVDSMTVQRVPVDDDEVRDFVLTALQRHTLLSSDERQDCADQILTAFAPKESQLAALRQQLAGAEEAKGEVLANFNCFRCHDGHTPLYCLNCAGDLLKQSAPAPLKGETIPGTNRGIDDDTKSVPNGEKNQSGSNSGAQP